jgi:hypothetical protein
VFEGPAFEVLPGGTGTNHAYFDNLEVVNGIVIPEPGTLALGALGAIVLGVIRRRRRS